MPTGDAWAEIPEAPLPPRHQALAGWTGTEMIVMGGSSAPPCPANADCTGADSPPLLDAAAYDPATGQWRLLADTPTRLFSGTATTAYLDGRLYVLTQEIPPGDTSGRVAWRFLSYDVEADRWDDLAGPDTASWAGLRLLPAGDRLVAYHGSQEHDAGPDLVFVPADPDDGDDGDGGDGGESDGDGESEGRGEDEGGGSWSELPADPLAPLFDRTMVWTGTEVALLGIPLSAVGEEGMAFVHRAAALDLDTGRWRELPDSTGRAERVVVAEAGEGAVDLRGASPGGARPEEPGSSPRMRILDPGTGTWSELPARPPDPPPGDGPPVPAGLPTLGVAPMTAGDTLLSRDWWALHVPTGQWSRTPGLPRELHEGAATVWAGDRMIVWGGAWFGASGPPSPIPVGDLTAGGWEWAPPGGPTGGA